MYCNLYQCLQLAYSTYTIIKTSDLFIIWYQWLKCNYSTHTIIDTSNLFTDSSEFSNHSLLTPHVLLLIPVIYLLITWNLVIIGYLLHMYYYWHQWSIYWSYGIKWLQSTYSTCTIINTSDLSTYYMEFIDDSLLTPHVVLMKSTVSTIFPGTDDETASASLSKELRVQRQFVLAGSEIPSPSNDPRDNFVIFHLTVLPSHCR